MSKFNKGFSAVNEESLERRRNTREERKVKEELAKIIFSFKDFDVRQIPLGQSYIKWQEENLLAYSG